ncbi:hypothetical protein [Sphingomonas sp. PB2P19]|uniref:hypothetical protein n=1 Tax=Sphingomonas rhamnosi TaxID=3096156 RepID=UPI002FC70BD8
MAFALRFARIGSVGLACALVTGVAQAKTQTRARLVHCGADSCVRLSGQRLRATTAIRVGGRELAVEGGRSWQATIPLATARTWPIARDYAVRVVFADSDAGTEATEMVPLPPGALGMRTQIASLVVSAR